MGRGRGGGLGGGRSSFSTKAVPRAAPAAKKPSPTTAPKAPAPATKNSGNDSIIGSIGSAFFEGLGWSVGYGMVQRAMDAVFGPRTINVVDATPTSPSSSAPAAAAVHPMLDACGAHKKAFQDCIAHQGSDVSKCQSYLDILNECLRDSAAAAVGTTTTTIL